MKPTDSLRKLEPKAKRFCEEYMIDLNGTQAAIRAGYSEKTANEQASRLLAKVNVSQYIAELSQKKLSKLEITAEKVLQEIAKLAFYDIRKIVDDTGRLKPIGSIDDDTAAAIASVDIVTRGNQEMGVGEITKIKLSDKTKNLELLARHLKLLTDKTELTGADGAPLIPIIKDSV